MKRRRTVCALACVAAPIAPSASPSLPKNSRRADRAIVFSLIVFDLSRQDDGNGRRSTVTWKRRGRDELSPGFVRAAEGCQFASVETRSTGPRRHVGFGGT